MRDLSRRATLSGSTSRGSERGGELAICSRGCGTDYAPLQSPDPSQRDTIFPRATLGPDERSPGAALRLSSSSSADDLDGAGHAAAVVVAAVAVVALLAVVHVAISATCGERAVGVAAPVLTVVLVGAVIALLLEARVSDCVSAERRRQAPRRAVILLEAVEVGVDSVVALFGAVRLGVAAARPEPAI